MSEDLYRRKAEALLEQASKAENMKERSRLIDEALHYHNLALDKRERPESDWADNDDTDGREATA